MIRLFLFLLFIAVYPLLSQACLDTEQILLSIADHGANGDISFVQLFNKEDGVWVKKTARFKAVGGRKGSSWGKSPFHDDFSPEKVEGDKRAPLGVFRITQTFGYKNTSDLSYKTKSPLKHLVVDENSVCIDDVNSSFYNQIILDQRKVTKDWHSFEKMKRSDRQYRYGAIVEHNPDNIKGKGSCIFLHVWNIFRTKTAGCTAMKSKHMKELIEKLDERYNPLLVQLGKEGYNTFKNKWCLPELN